MQILGTSPVNHAAQSQSSTGQSATNSTASLTSESTFLQLLVAQIKNQDPLNPTDSIQFVGQLVQYSELEQLIGINQGITSLTGGSTTTPPTNGKSSS
jgi:flagellar basal-body rod modification protein FlgD